MKKDSLGERTGFRSSRSQMLFKTSFFTEQLQWLLLRFNLCFQSSREQKSVPLWAINTRFSWRKVFSAMKISTSVQIYLREVIPDFFFYPFKTLRILNFALMKWFCPVTCFVKVFLLLFFSLKQIYHKRLFYNVVHTSSKMLSFLHCWDNRWKCEFDADVKIE